MTPAPVLPSQITPPPASGPSGLAVGVGGTGVAGAVVWIDHMLAAHGVTGPALMADLGPILTPLWANFPLLCVLIVAAYIGARMWRQSQIARALAEAHAAGDAAALQSKVGEVATGLVDLRGEVHGLRGALQAHADATDARLRTHDEGLRAVQVEVAGVARRVDVLEKPPRKRAPRSK